MSSTPRYTRVDAKKRRGATATPAPLARDLAHVLLDGWAPPVGRPVRVLEPSVGDGVLAEALLDALAARGHAMPVELTICDIDGTALARAERRLALRSARLRVLSGDFLVQDPGPADLVIANPPWVRTQVLGSAAAQELAARHGLRGRVDLAHAFLVRIVELLATGGRAASWVSNKLLSTRSAARVRAVLAPRLRAVWDLGDTRLFDAAVLPAALVLGPPEPGPRPMLRIHRSEGPPGPPLDLLGSPAGPARLPDGSPVKVERGTVGWDAPQKPWRLETPQSRRFLEAVHAHTGQRLGDLGRLRVGVKTTADAVFLRSDWEHAAGAVPELLRPATTHRSAHPLCPRHPSPAWRMLYPHHNENGVRIATPIKDNPATAAWLHAHEDRLRGRRYVRESGRAWYALWVPHDPDAWSQPKLVWRDIAERPCMWIDLEGTVVNGDCYWLAVDDPDDPRLWAAAAVGCSRLALRWYDHRCGNRLYAGRRRFLSQYMAELPLPGAPAALTELAAASRALYDRMHRAPEAEHGAALDALDAQVWRAFGLAPPPRRPPATRGP